MVKKALFMAFLGVFLPLICMEEDEAIEKPLSKPVVFITEVSNKTGQDYVLRHHKVAFSYIKAGQKLLLNKKMKLDHNDEDSSLLWWQLNEVTITTPTNHTPLASLNFSVIVTEGESFLTSSAYLYNYQEDLDGQSAKPLDNNIIPSCRLNPKEDRYHVNMQLILSGNQLQDSILDVVHILQPKIPDKNNYISKFFTN